MRRKFGRVRKQRRALMRGLVRELVMHGKITTTEAKAKELRPIMEKIITKGRSDTVSTRRLIKERTGSEAVSKKVIDEIALKYKDRHGGYTRIVKLPQRKGDGARMSVIEFV